MLACISCNPPTPPDTNYHEFPSAKLQIIFFSSCCHFNFRPKKFKFKHPFYRFTPQEALTLLNKKCANFTHLKQIHAKIIRHGLFEHEFDELLFRNLLQVCASCGQMDYATIVFHNQIQNQQQTISTFTWNIMIRSLTINSRSQQALLLYNFMLSQGYPPPDKFTFPFVIKACFESSAPLSNGKQVHALAVKTGYFAHNIFLQNILMDFYLNCGDIDSGRKVFGKMRVRNVVSWTTMTSGLLTCGKLDAAREVFDQMPRGTRNVVSWTTMIDGYVRNQLPEEAFELFYRMQLDNVKPNEFTFVSLLKACTLLGSLKLGAWLHDFAIKNGFEVERQVFLGTALVDMHSKCGSLEDAWRVFDSMQTRNLATWNSMITSLGVHGYGDEALALFAQMEKANVQPDAITFIGVLCACVHANNLDVGLSYFNYMTNHYGITPILEHYNCLIELYRRADMIDEVHKLVRSMPMNLNDDAIAALLMPSITEGFVDVEEALKPHDRESQYLGVDRCFKWDVG